ncbi:Hypothetical protein CpCap5W_0586 [Corynebacterium pseudotuberculosis]|nr:Hypothetical protein CpATCC19410_0603 [Corynebacterium pseudotuberculosis]AZN19447.1 hypothetical protein CpCap1W_0584 [Corynebacterium pseudotuberculosis]AZN21548.1 Hypothetical protein CpOviAF1_0582 [Corynebacterium pseudotuberculosis]QBB90583.1 hypothetical protein CpCR07_0586 [Corynebacterium pseudotuberculosis]QBB92688.1 hypothetical protein CpCAPNAT1_00583 [Corynebacterium pseudotuberculosis]
MSHQVVVPPSVMYLEPVARGSTGQVTGAQ